jgi:ParB family chromosome partitioning protein
MAASFKQMIKDGTVKRADAMRMRIEDLHEEPGFNLREDGPELDASVAELADYIEAGGQIPAVETRPREDGGAWIVDGHRRRRALQKLKDEGRAILDPNGELWVYVVPFVGNDVDRHFRIFTSNEDRKLSDLERAFGYKRAVAFGLKTDEIAKRAEKTRPHVEQMLILANANADVHALVRSGAVAATVAIETVRKHGEKAGDFLKGKLAGTGKKRVTEGDVKGKPLPRTVVDSMESSIDNFVSRLAPNARAVIAAVDSGQMQDAMVSVSAAELAELVKVYRATADARDAQEQKARNKAAKAAQGDIEDEPQQKAA